MSLTVAIVVLAGLHVAASSGIVAEGAKLVKASTGYSFTEGPAVDKHGDVYFTDQPNDRIVKWDCAADTYSDWMKPCGRSNGMIFEKHGNLIACADDKNELWSIAPDKKVTVLVKDFSSHLLNGPNDVWVRPDHAMYFTDPLYARPYWTRDKKMQQPGQHVFFLSSDHKTLRPVATDLTQPNGIVGTKDGKYLYVADIGANQTFRYKINPNGDLSEKTLFCSLGSDGMTMDDHGNVYLTGHGVTVFDKEGKQIEHIDIDEGWTANITFGGKDRRTLFITASTSVYTLKMAVRGIE